jgi:hypothetical protein
MRLLFKTMAQIENAGGRQAVRHHHQAHHTHFTFYHTLKKRAPLKGVHDCSQKIAQAKLVLI